MSIRKDVARAVRLREFYRSVEQLLTPGDRDYLFYALKEYNTYKSVAKLMLALNSCLDTPEKLDLLPSIRDLVPKHDRRKFDSLAPYNRMAHPPSAKEATERPKSLAGGGADAAEGEVKLRRDKSVRTLLLERSEGESLGFSVRGGREHDLGIFISQVDSFSLAEKSGLLAGDKIISVNGVSFESITHHSAVLILKSHNKLQISVMSAGHIPGRPENRKSLIWVDPAGQPVEEEPSGLSDSTGEDRAGGDRLLASPGRHKVVLHVDKKRPLGFSIRGGKEYSLGLYISQVDKDSLAEEYGLKVGDQILDINGHSFLSILHQEAVTILKSYPTLIMTIRSLGRLPVMVAQEPTSPDRKAGGGPSTAAAPSASSASQPDHTHPTHPPITTPLPTSTSTSPPSQQHTTAPSKAPSSPKHAQRRDKHRAGLSSNTSPHQKRWDHLRESVARRSQSFREFLRPRSIAVPPHTSHRHHHHHHHHHHHPHPHIPHHRHYQALDLAQPRPRTGSDSALFRHSKAHKTHQSPLAVSDKRASSHQPPSGPSSTPPGVPHSNQAGPQSPHSPSTRPKEKEEEEVDGPKFFQHGVGTQLMLASLSSSAKDMLMDSARRLLGREEIQALTERLKEYETSGGVEAFAEFLISLLDTPRKMQLLSDVRSVLTPSDLARFDELVSPHEIAALQKRAHFSERENGERDVEEEEGREGERSEGGKDSKEEGEKEEEEEGEEEGEKGEGRGAREDKEEEVHGQMEEREREEEHEGREGERQAEVEETQVLEEREGSTTTRDHYNLVLSDIQNHQGHGSLRRAAAREKGSERPELGAFGTTTASSLLSRATSDEPSITGVQTLESFLAWNEDYNTDSWERGCTHGFSQPTNPVVIEIEKSAPQLGLTIAGGIDTPTPGVFVTAVSENGAAGIDGFLQTGFEIVEVDGVRLRGMTHDAAARQLARAFRSENPTIELVVIPT